jgi:hypothetical protein
MINYLTPSAGGSGLTYPLEQITVNLTNADLKVLNSSPFAILPQGFYYNVINTTLKYNCSSVSSSSIMVICYESLQAAGGTFNLIDTTFMSGTNGMISMGLSILTSVPNSTNIEPLVLYSGLNDPTANFSLFELTVTYLKFT